MIKYTNDEILFVRKGNERVCHTNWYAKGEIDYYCDDNEWI